MRAYLLLFCLTICSTLIHAQSSVSITMVLNSSATINPNNKLQEENGIRDITVQLTPGKPLTRTVTIDLKINAANAPLSAPTLETISILLNPADISGGHVIKTIKVKLKAITCLLATESFTITSSSSNRGVSMSGVAALSISPIPIVAAPTISLVPGSTSIKPCFQLSQTDDGLRTVSIGIMVNGTRALASAQNLSFSIPVYVQSASHPVIDNSTTIQVPASSFTINGCPNMIQVPVVIRLRPVNKQEAEERFPILLSGDVSHAHTVTITNNPAKPTPEKEQEKGFTHACSNGKIFNILVTKKAIGGTITIKETAEAKPNEYLFGHYFHETDFAKWLFDIYGATIQVGTNNDCINFMASRVQQEMNAIIMNAAKDSLQKANDPKKDAANSSDKKDSKTETGSAASSATTSAAAAEPVTFTKTYLYNGKLFTTTIKIQDDKTSVKICPDIEPATCSEETITGKLDYNLFSTITNGLILRSFSLEQPDTTKYTPLLPKQFTDFTDYVAKKDKDKKDKDNKTKSDTIIARQQRTILELVQEMKDGDKVAGKMYMYKKVNVYRKQKGDISILAGYMEIADGSIQIDNNKIFDITFVGTLYDNEHNLVGPTGTVSNYRFSVSFKGLNNREFTNSIEKGSNITVHDDDDLFFNYADLIEFRPYKGDFSPIVKSEHYQLFPDSSVSIYRRRYSDYLSFRTFLDPLGFLGTNPNGFAQLEGDAVIPVSVRNYRKYTFIPELHANFSYIYTNTITSEKRMAKTVKLANDSFFVFDPVQNNYVKKADSSNYMYNLDIVKNAYYQLYIRGAVISMEVKKQNSWLNLEIGFRVFGANVATKTDTTKYHKIVPEINFKWMLRPDNIFGADLNLGISWLSNLHRANNNPYNVNDPAFIWKSGIAFPHELNIYVNTGKESKGGLFFRYNGWYSINSKLATSIDERLIPSTAQSRKTAYFPQLLFGYSTNLSTMIKRDNDSK